MAHLVLHRERLQNNYQHLDRLFRAHDITWGIVSKLFCGTEIYLQELIKLGTREILDSRISNLEKIKTLDESVTTVYIKPPAQDLIEKIIAHADVSFNTEYETIRLLSEEAGRQGKMHRIIIMIEMGDLREGVMREDLVDFYQKIFELPNIQVIGLGTNLNCLSGVMPSDDKLIQLSLYKQIIELKFKRTIPWISAGTSVTLPMLLRQQLPAGTNHFRIGETLYFGNNLVEENTIEGMVEDVLELHAQIIEVNEKPLIPSGELAANPSGDVFEVDAEAYGKTTNRAIIDIGLLDINPDYISPKADDVEVVGASSDMIILDLKDNPRNLKAGDAVTFRLKYMGALSLLNSDYIEKRIT